MRVVLVALCALALAGTASAALPTTYVDRAMGYRITVPGGWQLVPRSVAAVDARAAQLRRQGKTALADQFAAITANPNVVKDLTLFRFQAFQWPSRGGAVATDVSVKIDRLQAGADAARIAAQFRQTLARGGGSRVEPIAQVALPAGRAFRLRGSLPLAGSQSRTGFTLYLLVRAERLYSISFRNDAAMSAGAASTFLRIARSFRFV